MHELRIRSRGRYPLIPRLRIKLDRLKIERHADEGFKRLWVGAARAGHPAACAKPRGGRRGTQT